MKVVIEKISADRFYVFLVVPNTLKRCDDNVRLPKYIGKSEVRARKEAKRIAEIYDCSITEETRL